MILTDEERRRFAAYLRRDAASGKIIVEQLRKLNMPAGLVKRHLMEIAAAEVVAEKLEQAESQTLGSPRDERR